MYLDPNRDVGHKLGQTIYAFILQASYGVWKGGKDGLVTSVRSLRKRDLTIFRPRADVYAEILLLAVLCATVLYFAGWTGLLVGVATMVFSKRNWSGAQDRLAGGQAVSGSQGRPSARVVRASKKWTPCLAAVAR